GIGVRGIAPELTHAGTAGPGVFADLGAFELARRVDRQSIPEADHVGAGGNVADVAVVRVGDPEGRGGVVRRDQNLVGLLPGGTPSRCRRRQSGGAKVRRLARQCGMTLGLDAEVPDELVAGFDAILEEEAVT